jgi:Protein of unknown function (DUF1579)
VQADATHNSATVPPEAMSKHRISFATVLTIVIVVIGTMTIWALRYGSSSAAPELVAETPNWARRGMPGPGHAALEPLVGRWKVRMSVRALLGRTSDDPPLVSDDLVATKQWIAGGRYLEDTTTGSMAGANYWRRGWLGYSNVDARYEWVTIDITSSNMMSYSTQRGSGPHLPIMMTGTFTDQGVTGESNAYKIVGMRTVIHVYGKDRHALEFYVRPPGEPEVLAVRMDYVRLDSVVDAFPVAETVWVAQR